MWRCNCNAHTAGIYRGSLGNHILPALGELAVDAVGREHAAALHYGLRDTPRAANRALMVLTKMFSLAEAWGLAPEGSNPCRFVRQLQGASARAVPDAGRVPAPGPGNGRGTRETAGSGGRRWRRFGC